MDIHQAKLTVCILYENEAGELITELKEFGGFKKDRQAMADWVAPFKPELVVMESTGIYWKSPYAALEKHGLKLPVVNARHVKQVPGRKTDIADAQWIAMLARNGLLRGGFVPSVNFRELRLVSRQMQKLTGMLSREKNRLHNESADKKKTGKARKGNPYVRRILCEAANAARRTRCSLQDKFKGLKCFVEGKSALPINYWKQCVC